MLSRGGYYIFIRALLYVSSGFIKRSRNLFGLYQRPQTELRNQRGKDPSADPAREGDVSGGVVILLRGERRISRVA